MGSNKWEMILPSKVRQKKIILRNLDIVVWTSGVHNPLVHTDFNMFVDEWTSANESPVSVVAHSSQAYFLFWSKRNMRLSFLFLSLSSSVKDLCTFNLTT